MPSTILIVDDDATNIALLKADLQDAGFETLTAENGRCGLSVLRENAEIVDVILLDRMMPELDGIGFLAELQTEPELAAIPVIMQTAKAAPNNIMEGIDAGAYYYLTRPFSDEVMLNLVRTAIDEVALRTQLREQLAQHEELPRTLVSGKFRFRSLGQARYLGGLLAAVSPNPRKFALPLTELLVNAVEHGIASVTYKQASKCRERSSDIHDESQVLDLSNWALRRSQYYPEGSGDPRAKQENCSV